MVKDYHQHQEPPPGGWKKILNQHGGNLTLPASILQVLICLVSIVAVVFILNLLVNPTRAKLRRLAKISKEPIGQHFTGNGLYTHSPAKEMISAGLIAYLDENWTTAEENLERAVAIEKDQTFLQYYLALVKLHLNNPQRALLHFQKVTVSADYSLREKAFWHIAQANLLLGKAQESIAALQEVISLNGALREKAQKQLRQIEAILGN